MKKSLVVALPIGAALVCTLVASQSSTRLAAQNAAARSISSNLLAVQLQTTQPVQAAQLDLSSPEKSVRAFIAAVNTNRFEEAALCVDGASPKADFKPLRDMVGEGKNKIVLDKPIISLSVLTSSIKGDQASLKVKVAVKSGTNQQSRTENVLMVRRNARWLLVPPNPQDVVASANFLASYATLIRSPKIIADAMSRARTSAHRANCSSNLKQIWIAAYLFALDNNEKLAITPQNFKTTLFLYLETMQVFRCPSVHSGESYSFNGNLSNFDFQKLSDVTASQLVMFYEGKNGKLDFRHLGAANVAFADGHVKSITRAEAKTLKWKP